MYQTMDIVYDMSESQLNELLLCMPVCTPWKMFYLITSRLVPQLSILGCILLDKTVFLAVYSWIRQHT